MTLSGLLLASNSIFFIFSALALVASIAIFFLTRVNDRQKDRDLAEYQASAARDTEKAKTEAARANERAAGLEKATADAKLEQERLKAQFSWRYISSEQINTLVQALSVAPGNVNLRYTDGDPEALSLAIQIGNLLERAGWQVAPGSEKFSNALVFGIVIPGPDNSEVHRLRDAFLRSSINYTSNDLPPLGISFNVSTIPGAPTLMIGSKRPPLP